MRSNGLPRGRLAGLLAVGPLLNVENVLQHHPVPGALLPKLAEGCGLPPTGRAGRPAVARFATVNFCFVAELARCHRATTACKGICFQVGFWKANLANPIIRVEFCG